jgi:fructokinase
MAGFDNPSRLAQPAAHASPILLFGELLADCFPDREVIGGAPFNVARHLRGLGRQRELDPVLVTRIGKDERGARFLEVLQSAGLAIDGVQQDLLRPSGQVRVTLDADTGGHRFEIAPDQAWDFIHADMARLIGLLCRPQWLYFGTLAQRGASRRGLRALLQTTRAHGFLDLNLRDPWVRKEVLRWSLDKAEIVKLNLDELRRVTRLFNLTGATPRLLGESFITAFRITQLLVTEGDAGAWLLDAGHHYVHTSSTGPAIKVVDSVGAGDAFSAVFLLGLLCDWPDELTLDRAHRFAGEICLLRGAIPENDTFYRPFIAEWGLDEEQTL